MRLTAFTDYCLRVLIYVAAQPERRATIGEIARSYGISEHHLTKVVHFLGKVGLLANVRGKGGGLALARPATDIVVGDVVRQAQGRDRAAECFDGEHSQCSIASLCALKDVLAEALAAFHAVLDRYTLQDLVRNRSSLARILFVPHAASGGAAKENAS
jgi:Rrf2 family nitric oxide-sensitive transcriptional repressor